MTVKKHYPKEPWKAFSDSKITENSVLGPVEMVYLKTSVPASFLYAVDIAGVYSERLKKRHADPKAGAVSGILYKGEKITPDKPKVLISTPKSVAETFLSTFKDYSLTKIKAGAKTDPEFKEGYRVHESNPVVHSIKADMQLLHQKELLCR